MNRIATPASRSARVRGTATVIAVAGLSFALIATPLSPAFADTPYPAAERYAPTPIPDRVTLIPTEDPSHSQRVNWRSSADSAKAQILEAPAAFGDVYRDNEVAYNVTNVDAYRTTTVDPKTGYVNEYHTVQFDDLKPGTRYSYRVGDGTNTVHGGTSSNWTPWMDFTTEAATAEPYSFIYFGDAQNYLDSSLPRVFQEAVSDRPDARLVLHAGDLVNQTGTTDANLQVQEKEWGEWYDAAGYNNQTRNVLAIPGNHEYNSSTAISAFWKPQFPFPENGPMITGTDTPLEAVKQSAYYVDYQGVRYIALDSSPLQNGPVQEDVLAAQTAWFESVLSDPDRPKWTVVTFHHPVYAGTSTRNNSVVRDNWDPLIEEYGVDMVLQGHDHVYNRGNKISDDDPTDPTKSNGTVYSISVSGGKMYELNGGENWSENGANLRVKGENIQLFQLIDVEQDKLTYQARLSNDTFFDGYTIEKSGTTWNGDKTVTDITVDPEVDVEVPDAVETTTTIATDAATAVVGAEVTLTATVAGGGAGTVTFRDGATALGTDDVKSGIATLTVSDLSRGAHAITATFVPTKPAEFTGSVSTAVAVTITGAPVSAPVATTTAISTPASIRFGTTAKVTATVAGKDAAGTVTFRDGTTIVGTSSLSKGAATVTLAGLSVGAHALSATFVPSNTAAFTPSASAGSALTVLRATTTAKAKVSSASAKSGKKVTVTVTVTSSAGTPTGTVSIVDTTTGKTWSSKAKLSKGSVTITSPALKGKGSHKLVVTYSGSTNFEADSATAKVTVK